MNTRFFAIALSCSLVIVFSAVCQDKKVNNTAKTKASLVSADVKKADTVTTKTATVSAVAKKVDTVKTKTTPVPEDRNTVDTLIIKARLIEIPGKFAPNDLYNYVYFMKYRVLGVEKGVFKGKEILVGHYNPLIPRSMVKDKMDPYVNGDVKKFEVGSTHLLKLVEPIESVWADAVEDEYFDSDEKYYAISADDRK